jgi:hypothetical protein
VQFDQHPVLSRIRRYAANTLLVVLAAFAGVLLSELILRLWTPAVIGQTAFRGSHRIRHHILLPGSSGVLETPEFSVRYAINGQGLRDDEVLPKQSGEFRIAILGDSFTEGFGVDVESCYVQRVERSLNTNAAGGLHFNVLNCGVVSYSPLLELIQLKEQVLALSPDLVIVAFDMTDLDDDKNYSAEAVFAPSGEPIGAQNRHSLPRKFSILPSGELRTFIRDNSYVFALVNTAMISLWPPPIQREWLQHTTDLSVGQWREKVDRSLRFLGFIGTFCRDRGIPLVLVTYPFGHQASSSEWVEGRKRYGIGPGRFDSFIFDELGEFAQKSHMPFLNMTDAFRSHSDGSLYFPMDGHWTPRGHAVAADTLVAYLRNSVL